MSEIEITGVFENVLGMIYSAKQKAERHRHIWTNPLEYSFEL